jgi:hypothetical protein
MNMKIIKLSKDQKKSLIPLAKGMESIEAGIMLAFAQYRDAQQAFWNEAKRLFPNENLKDSTYNRKEYELIIRNKDDE